MKDQEFDGNQNVMKNKEPLKNLSKLWISRGIMGQVTRRSGEQCVTLSRWNALWRCVGMSTASSTTSWSYSGLEVRIAHLKIVAYFRCEQGIWSSFLGIHTRPWIMIGNTCMQSVFLLLKNLFAWSCWDDNLSLIDMTYDTWHVTQGWVNIVSKFQLPSSLGYTYRVIFVTGPP